MHPLKTSLQLEDEIELHKKAWIVQRVGWVLLFLTVIAASVGLFGNGILSKRTMTKSGTEIRFERFARLESPFVLRIETSAVGPLTTVALPQAYLTEMKIRQVQPQPASEEVKKGMTVFSFSVDDGAVINFFLEPQTIGTLQGQFLVNNTSFDVSQYIYP